MLRLNINSGDFNALHFYKDYPHTLALALALHRGALLHHESDCHPRNVHFRPRTQTVVPWSHIYFLILLFPRIRDPTSSQESNTLIMLGHQYYTRRLEGTQERNMIYSHYSIFSHSYDMQQGGALTPVRGTRTAHFQEQPPLSSRRPE